ncbi:MAG: tyrosine protein phosphatase [Pseudomonadota bacterium]|nr:tyrosine protein phosphatase [Pseudomonadota bacterium]
MWKRGLTKGFLNKVFSYLDSSFSDHGFLRILWTSFSKLPGGMYRCNQPYPFQIFKYKKKYGVKTIINLRGERNCSSFFLESEFCKNNNIDLYNFPITSRDLPSKKTIKEFFFLLDNIKFPAMMHCKSGADRAGIASCLYLIYKHNYNVDDALKQLSFKYLHIKYAKTGILDYFFETAINKGKVTSKDFLNWIDADYNKNEIKKSFKSNGVYRFVVDKILNRE